MKWAVLMALVLGVPSLGAVSRKCNSVAEKEVVKRFSSYFYYRGRRVRQVEGSHCVAKVSKARKPYVSCDVGASTGDGAGDVSFQVLLNEKCSSAFAAFITGEE